MLKLLSHRYLSLKQWKRVNEEIRQILNNIHDEVEEDNEGTEANLFEYLFLTYKRILENN